VQQAPPIVQAWAQHAVFAQQFAAVGCAEAVTRNRTLRSANAIFFMMFSGESVTEKCRVD
jgi:hypothetical protein